MSSNFYKVHTTDMIDICNDLMIEYDVFQGIKSNCDNKLEIGAQLVKRLETPLRIKTNYCR